MQYAVADGPNLGLRGAWRRILPPGSRRDLFIREIASTFARDRGTSLEQCLSDGRVLAGWLSPTGGKTFAMNRSAIRAMMVEHLERRSWRGLSWLWVQDAHLASENDDCWAIVDQLMLRDVPALVLVDAADDRITPSLLELRARHHKAFRQIRLEPLRGRDAEALVQAHLPLDPDLTRLLVPRASEQPKLVKDLLLHWVRTGELHEQVSDSGQGRVWTLSGGMPDLPLTSALWPRLGCRQPSSTALVETHCMRLRLRGAAHRRVSSAGCPEKGWTGSWSMASSTSSRAGVSCNRRRSNRSSRNSSSPVGPGRCTHGWPMPGEKKAMTRGWRSKWAGIGTVRGTRPGPARSLCGASTWASTLSVDELQKLAEQTRDAAEAHGAAEEAWRAASQAMANAVWRAGDAKVAWQIDRKVLDAALAPDGRMQVLCSAIRRNIQTSLLDSTSPVRAWLSEAESLLPNVRTPRRADFHATKAWLRAAQMDVDGALAEVLDALSCRPSPEVVCRSRILRAQLLATIDPMVSWHEALRVVETARDYGLLRYEVVAWGLMAVSMVHLGRADEVIERLKSGVQRLEAHGERASCSAVGSGPLGAGSHGCRSRGSCLRGLDCPASQSGVARLAAPTSGARGGGLPGRAGHHARRGRKGALSPSGLGADDTGLECGVAPAGVHRRRSAGRCAAIIPGRYDPQHRPLRSGYRVSMFLAKLLVIETREIGFSAIADGMARAYEVECARLGVDPDEALPWVERARRARRRG